MNRTPSLGHAPRLRVFALGWALLVLMGSCDRGASKHDPPQRHEIPAFVTIGEVTEAKIPIVMKFSGTIQAIKNVQIIPRVSGYIDKRYFVEGTYVQKDAPLYLIDPRPFQDRLDQLKAQLKGFEANRTFAQAEVARYRKAGATGAVSQEQVDESVAKVEEAEASVESTQAAIESAKLDLSYTNITAPFDGRVQNTLINVGNLVSAEKDVLTSVVQIDPIYVLFNLSRRELYEMQQMELQGLVSSDFKKLKVEVLLPDGAVHPQQGHVDFVSAEIDPSTDTLMMRGVLQNPYENKARVAFVPGQYVAVRLIVGEKPNALLIPQKALVETQAGQHVFVLDKNNKASSRKVVVSTSYQGQWVVEKGLQKGERIVADGVQKVRPGVVVKTSPPQGKQPAEAPKKKP